MKSEMQGQTPIRSEWQNFDAFERRFSDLESESLEGVEEWIASRHAGINLKCGLPASNQTIAKISRTDVGPNSSLVSYRWSVPVEGHFTEDYPAFFLVMCLFGQVEMDTLRLGRHASGSEQLRMYSRSAGHKNRVTSNYTSLSLTVSNDFLEERARSTFDCELDEPLEFEPLIDLDTTKGRVMGNLIFYVTNQLASNPDLFGNIIQRTAIEELVVSTILMSWPSNYERYSNEKLPDRIPVRIREAEEFMHAHCDRPLTLKEIAAHAGCGERTLQAVFKTRLNMTPMQRLREIRLERAHRDIVETASSITDIALRWGFTNPSRFAQIYFDRFGTKPSRARRLPSLLV